MALSGLELKLFGNGICHMFPELNFVTVHIVCTIKKYPGRQPQQLESDRE